MESSSSQGLARLEVLHVIPGYLCNLSCSHCVTRSGPQRLSRLTEAELKAVIGAVKRHRPRLLLFTGGEPTLYINDINDIVASHPEPSESGVQITTNGWFARSARATEAVLGRLSRLNRLQLSYDHFHGSPQTMEQAIALASWCRERGVIFNTSVAITSPTDMIFADELQRRTGERVVYTFVEAAGRARERRLEYRFDRFQPEVLEATCPGRGTLTYIAGRGFTLCCANLAFNSDSPDFVHPTAESHLSSRFFQDMSTKSMGQLLNDAGLEVSKLLPNHSSPCGLCERIHSPAE